MKPLPMASPGDWRSRALCRNYDPEIWFAFDEPGIQAAKRICRDCPVQQPCVEEALAFDDDGVRGALSKLERDGLVRRARRAS